LYSLYDYAQMISSRRRVELYTEALRQDLREGDVVCDLGTGLGPFAILAAQMGARRVYAIEPNDAIKTAAEIAEASGCADKIEFFQDLSVHVSLPEPVDLIISDLHGTLPFHGAHIPALVDARRRFLKPAGRLIPQGDSLWLSVVCSEKLYKRHVEPWAEAPGIDFAPLRRHFLRQPSRCRATVQQLLPEKFAWGRLDYRTIENPSHQGSVSWRIEQPATGYGLCLWFDGELTPGVKFSNSPDSPPLPYSHLFLPWEEPLDLVPEQWITISVDARFSDPGYAWRWIVTVRQEDENGPILQHLDQTSE